jgi:hypothetical protein
MNFLKRNDEVSYPIDSVFISEPIENCRLITVDLNDPRRRLTGINSPRLTKSFPCGNTWEFEPAWKNLVASPHAHLCQWTASQLKVGPIGVIAPLFRRRGRQRKSLIGALLARPKDSLALTLRRMLVLTPPVETHADLFVAPCALACCAWL